VPLDPRIGRRDIGGAVAAADRPVGLRVVPDAAADPAPMSRRVRDLLDGDLGAHRDLQSIPTMDPSHSRHRLCQRRCRTIRTVRPHGRSDTLISTDWTRSTDAPANSTAVRWSCSKATVKHRSIDVTSMPDRNRAWSERTIHLQVVSISIARRPSDLSCGFHFLGVGENRPIKQSLPPSPTAPQQPSRRDESADTSALSRTSTEG